MERVALDTTFLIDLQNERRSRGRSKGAVSFLDSHQDTELCLPSVALGEYLEGFDDPASQAALALVAPLQVLDVTDQVAMLYATTVRRLRASGRLIGSNDLWIGCTALAAGLPIATHNASHFRRIRGLIVVDYSK